MCVCVCVRVRAFACVRVRVPVCFFPKQENSTTFLEMSTLLKSFSGLDTTVNVSITQSLEEGVSTVYSGAVLSVYTYKPVVEDELTLVCPPAPFVDGIAGATVSFRTGLWRNWNL